MSILIVTILVMIVSIVVLNSKEESSQTVAETPVDVVGTICIDAGHGGSDTGAVATDGITYEKDDNLKLALKVKEYLENMGFTVIMTREDDTYVDLNDRCKIANTSDADLFISLHRNSSESLNARGAEVWVHSSKPPIDIALAENILDNLMGIPNQKSRGIEYGYRGDSSDDYRVNKLTTMPSCLIETGFISNVDDMNLFNQNLDEFAMAISMGVYETLEDIAKGKVDTSRGKAGQNWDGFNPKS